MPGAVTPSAPRVADERLPVHPRAVLSSAPRYGIGERVTLPGGGNRWARVQSECRVLAVLPHDSGPFRYRVRSEAESYERVVVETDLAPGD